MVEIEEDNPPKTLEFNSKAILTKLAQMPAATDGWLFESFVKNVLQKCLKSQIAVKVSRDKVYITLYQPCAADEQILTKD